jgi:hypothetical protein
MSILRQLYPSKEILHILFQSKPFQKNFSIIIPDEIIDIIHSFIKTTIYLDFLYCTEHDDGILVLYDSVYDSYKSVYDMSEIGRCCCSNCNSEWIHTGCISYNGTKVEIISRVRVNYSMYCGGWEFYYFLSSFKSKIDPKSELYRWFHEINEKCNTTWIYRNTKFTSYS